MGFISKLFTRRQIARPQTSLQTTSHDRPFVIELPTVGFLNLRGSEAEAMASEDSAALAPLFRFFKASSGAVPQCQVLFIYCLLDQSGRVAGSSRDLREIIQEAQAYIVIVASNNDLNAYKKAMGSKRDWPANIVMTLDRKAGNFTLFFRRLFDAMFSGKSMLTAWVELAPQIPGRDQSDVPDTVFAAEAGHIVFKQNPKM